MDGGTCGAFRDQIQRYFQDTLTRFEFQCVGSSAQNNGKDCTVVYRAQRCQLLFLLSDGAANCTIGSLDAQFPTSDVGLYEDGQLGWYHVVSLVEFKSGQRLLTRRLLDEVAAGQRDYFAWQAQLLTAWADRLFELVASGQGRTWQADFAAYVQAKQKRW